MKTVKKIRTNSIVVREQVKKHILECVLDENENEFNIFPLLQDYVRSEFNRVANYPNNLKRIPNKQDRFSDYLNGLPFSFEYYYDGVKDFLNGLGINPTNKEYSDSDSIKLYHYLIFKEIFNN